jgi:iron-sulfur cluster assembly protein
MSKDTAHVEEPLRKAKRRLEVPAAVILTAAAEERVARLMAQAPAGAIGVKLSTPRRGCSGLAYSVDYVTEAAPFDERIETPGGIFFIDGASVLYLVGSTMDWVEDDFTAGFTFANPNAKGSCGCGESFTV